MNIKSALKYIYYIFISLILICIYISNRNCEVTLNNIDNWFAYVYSETFNEKGV